MKSMLYKIYTVKAKIDLILEDEECNEAEEIKAGTEFKVYERLFRFTLVYTIINGKNYDICLDEFNDEGLVEVLNIEYTDIEA